MVDFAGLSSSSWDAFVDLLSEKRIFMTFLVSFAFTLVARRILNLFSNQKRKKLTPTYVGDRDSRGRMHGAGHLVLSNGNAYEGSFRHGKFHGTGTYTFSKTNSSYSGGFRDGVYSGKGEENYADGSRYSGSFKDGMRDGRGELVYTSGASFNGTWKDGRKHGHGTFYYANGNWKHVGEFRAGKKNGAGESHCKTFKVVGTWMDGKQSDVKLVVANRSRFDPEEYQRFCNVENCTPTPLP